MPKTLLIAPRMQGLVAEDEVQLILRSGLDVTPLLGPVTLREVLAEAEEDHDVLWLATHGGSDGLRLADGIWAIGDVASFAKGFDVVVLNTCHSLSIAQLLQRESGAHVIFTVGEAQDRTAIQVGARLAWGLVNLRTVREAYEYARPAGNTTYLYLEGRTQMTHGSDEWQALSAQIAEIKLLISRDVALLYSRVWLLERIIVALIIIVGVLVLMESWVLFRLTGGL